jgi:AraC-like DNA-binding protein
MLEEGIEGGGSISKSRAWVSLGRENHVGMAVPVAVAAGGEQGLWEEALGAPDRLKIVLLRSHGGFLREGGAALPVVSPSLLLLPRGAIARLDLPRADPGDSAILFHPSFVDEDLDFDSAFASERKRYDAHLLNRFAPDAPLRRRAIPIDAASEGFFRSLMCRARAELESQRDAYWPCRSRSFLLQLLIGCEQAGENAELRSLAEEDAASDILFSANELNPVQTYIYRNLDKKLSVDGIAAEFGTNRTSLQERFRRILGMSVLKYVQALRIRTASLLLARTSLEIPEIMSRTGFADATHFSRSFKRYAEKTPSEFRREFKFPSYLRG